MSRQKVLDGYPKPIQQIEFVEQLKNDDGVNADGTQSMLVLTILDKKNIKNETKFLQESVTAL